MSSMQVEASPQPGNFNWRKRLRQDSGSGSESERKTPRLTWNYITLESESPPPSEEDTESVYSVQGQETEFCRDTSDTDSSESWSSYSVDVGDILMRVEYEVDSECDKSEKFVFGDGESSSGTEGVVDAATDFLVAAICDSDLALWADTEDSKSGYSTDSELGRADFWTCIQCKSKNNNPLFRYCEKCYQVRKNFFPPRPKGKKKKKSVTDKSDSKYSSTTTEDETIGSQFLRGLSQDSGVSTGLSQESIDLMDLGKIKIPENLLKQTQLYQGLGDDTKPGSSRDDGSLVSVDLVRTDQEVVLYSPKVNDCVKSMGETVKCEREGSKVVVDSVEKEINIKDATESNSCDNLNSSSLTLTHVDNNSNEESDKSSSLCITCMSHEKDAVFMHAGPLHMCCCYKCAMRVWTECKRCPVCNRKISNVKKVCVA